MNQQNLDYLKKDVKYFGFGEKLGELLESNIKEQPDKFQLRTDGEFKRGDVKGEIYYTLDFKKSDTTEKYFFNSYRAVMNQDGKQVQNTFHINKGMGMTAKEAFNLLEGRAVFKELTNKEGEKYKAWVQLDFKEPKNDKDNYLEKKFHSQYGYDLEAAASKFPIRELTVQEDKDKLMKSLEKGNLQQVNFVNQGTDTKMFISANPQFKNLNVYDSNLKSVYLGADNKKSAEQSADQSEAQSQQQTNEKKERLQPESDDESNPIKKQGRKKGMRV